MPGGHLATAVALGGVAYGITGSVQAAAGCFAGGFLIDVDHYLDYLIFEKQWRRPWPLSFLRYYFSFSPRRLVLPLHSIELMTIIKIGILIYASPLLIGYWFGAAMHLIFDILINGDHALRRPVLFYFLGYRAWHRFDAAKLLAVTPMAEAGDQPVKDFFSVRPARARRAPDYADYTDTSASSA